jgi:virginiamycin B lyase
MAVRGMSSEARSRVSLLVLITCATVAGGLSFSVVQASAMVYWSSNAGDIGRANLNGTGVNDGFITDTDLPYGVAVNGEHVYWTNYSSGTLGRANLNGTGAELSFIREAGGYGLGVRGQYIYWTNYGSGTIERANVNGTEVDQSLITGANGPSGVAIDGEHIYWTNLNGHTIGRAKLNGTEVNQSFIAVTGTPVGVAVNGEHVYWTNSESSVIGRSKLDGSEAEQNFITGASTPDAVALDGEHIYWTNPGLHAIGRAKLDGSEVEQSFISGAGTPIEVAVNSIESSGPAPSTWSGESPGSTMSLASWSLGGNWEGDVPPTAVEGITALTFPRLTNPSCTAATPTDACYLSFNDVSGFSAESISIDDGDDYELFGEEIKLGSGGLTASPANGSGGPAGDTLELPISLTAKQTWSIAGRSGGALGENGIALEGDLTGSANALTFEISNEAVAFLANDTEVGPVAIDGANANKPGILNGFVELLGADLNSSDGNPVSLNHIFLIGSGALGPLSTNEAELIVEERIQTPSATFDEDSDVGFEIDSSGSTPGTDYSQLTSTGAVALGGSKLLVHVPQPPKKKESEPEPPCPSLIPGQKYTLLSTTGTLSGAFGNAPEGTEIAISFAKTCSQTSEKMRIVYSRSGGTETVTGTVEAAAKEKQEEEEAAAKKKHEEEAASTKKHEEEIKNEEATRKLIEEHSKKVGEEAAGAEASANKHLEEEATAAAKKHAEEAAAASALATKHQEEEAGAQKQREAKEEKAKVSTKPLTSAQLLAKALKTCKKQPRKQRAKCEAMAKKRYGPKKKVKKK